MERPIIEAVARADLILCQIGSLPWGKIALPGLLLVSAWLLAGEVRKWRT